MENKPLKVVAGAPDKPMMIGDIEIPCFVLEDETRVINLRGFHTALNLSFGGRNSKSEGAAQLPRFAASKSLAPHIKAETKVLLNSPILFRIPGGIAYGYPATVLVDMCNAVLEARRANALRPQQQAMAERCERLVLGFARTGIIALVDEVTGYQEIRANNAISKILERYITEDYQVWTKTFPDEFYRQIYRLNGWGEFGLTANYYSIVGHFTNDIVYERLAPGVLDELRKKNPTMPEGYRKHKHHQFLTPEHGHPKLREHLLGVIALMKSHERMDEFMQSLSRVYPKTDEQIAMAMGNYWTQS